MKHFAIAILLLCKSAFAQSGYNIITGNPIWISENYLDYRTQPWGTIADAGEVYRSSSDFSPNPLTNTSDYRFDYLVTSHMASSFFTGSLTYLVNSADNSWAIPFDDQENPELVDALKDEFPDNIKLHFLIRKADRSLLACGLFQNEKTGNWEKRGFVVDSDVSIFSVYNEELEDLTDWLTRAEPLTAENVGSSGATPQMVAMIEHVPIEGLRAGGPSGETVDMYVVKYPALERITVPLMGFGNGVLKNTEKNINQLVVWLAARNVPWQGGTTDLFLYLEKLFKGHALFNVSQYEVTTILNQAGQQDLQDMQAWAMEKAREISRLTAQMRECPEGNAGKTCRERLRNQIKAIQDEMKEKTERLMDKHRVPMD